MNSSGIDVCGLAYTLELLSGSTRVIWPLPAVTPGYEPHANRVNNRKCRFCDLHIERCYFINDFSNYYLVFIFIFILDHLKYEVEGVDIAKFEETNLIPLSNLENLIEGY